MNGATLGSLHVMRQFNVNVDGKEQLWSESGPQGDVWRKTKIYIGALQNFTISIEAHRGMKGFHGCNAHIKIIFDPIMRYIQLEAAPNLCQFSKDTYMVIKQSSLQTMASEQTG